MASANSDLYEGLFLMSQQAGGDLSASLKFISDILERAGAETLTVQKWDDRKLAYNIRGQKRGAYVIALFRVTGVQIANIERDCTLSDEVTRVLITRAEHMGDTEIQSMVQSGQQSADEARLREEQGQDQGQKQEAGT